MLTFGGLGGANDLPLPNAGAAAAGTGASSESRLVGAALGRASSAPTIGGSVPCFVCLAITSRRCFWRRRSSRHSRTDARPRAAASVTLSNSAPKRRPNEKCVDRMIAMKISMTMTINEPVGFRYSDNCLASHSPA